MRRWRRACCLISDSPQNEAGRRETKLTLTVGIIANPFSARDIRRVIADAAGLQLADRANIVLRVLAALFVCGVGRVVVMPDNAGLLQHVLRGISRSRNQGLVRYPELIPLDMTVTGRVDDSVKAATMMRAADVAAIVVLGGDGTHRAVVSRCGSIPIAALSTGTNNAFSEPREPTITGLAVGLAATGRVPPDLAFSFNKRLDVSIDDAPPAIALVDVAIVTDRHIGARALWRTETFRELFVTFADPNVIGMSAIAGLLDPVSRIDPYGLRVAFRAPGAAEARVILNAPIAPGLIAPIGVKSWERMRPRETLTPLLKMGSIAFDGEREISFSEKQRVSITLRDNAFRSVDALACMRYAATHGLMRKDLNEQRQTGDQAPPFAAMALS